MSTFRPLRVEAVEPLTDDAVAVSLAVPPELRSVYGYAPGQHITLRRHVAETGQAGGTGESAGPGGGLRARRTYSLCAPAEEAPATLRIGIRGVPGGEFSTYALKELAPGDLVDVLPPAGRFVLDPRPGRFAAVVGGSGITPVLSIAATLLEREPEARFCLLRSDRSTASTMFLDEVADLKDRFPDRFQLVPTLTKETRQSGLPGGRLDEERLTGLLPALLPVAAVDGWFLCGPFGLVEGAARALRGLGVPRARIHQEVFHVDEPPEGPAGGSGPGSNGSAPGAGWRPGSGPGPVAGRGSGSGAVREAATLAATLDGRSDRWPVDDGESVLETVLRHRTDAPFACRGGVCGTCRVRLVSGEVRMERNYALEPDELAAGYVLACQSRPVTETVEVDFDG